MLVMEKVIKKAKLMAFNEVVDKLDEVSKNLGRLFTYIESTNNFNEEKYFDLINECGTGLSEAADLCNVKAMVINKKTNKKITTEIYFEEVRKVAVKGMALMKTFLNTLLMLKIANRLSIWNDEDVKEWHLKNIVEVLDGLSRAMANTHYSLVES